MTSPPPPPPPSATTRRIPPPCWSPDETSALIDTYRDKWHSLRRSNLRASHWQDVADSLAALSPPPLPFPPKTPTQCRHKMEKLRKRYRAEIRKFPNRRFSSSWVLFPKMHDMEKPEDDKEAVFEPDFDGSDRSRSGLGLRSKKSGELKRNLDVFDGSGSELGLRSKKSGGLKRNFDGFDGSGSELGFGLKEFGGFGPGLDYGASGGDGLMGMVDAVRMLGEEFVKAERMKMDVVREIEEMRMEMERKRELMIMESQRRLLEVFVEGVSAFGRKAKKGVSGSEFLDAKEPDS